ncbi:MAG: hypothetical protein ACTSXZ_11160, partial [Alphaproteobacteria bacterium]
MRGKIIFSSLIVICLSLLIGCVSTPSPGPTTRLPATPEPVTTPPPPPVNAQLWVGDWEEDWPGSTSHDQYRVQVINNGYTILIEPLTNVEKQRLSNIRWDGRTLNFTLHYNTQVYQYTLLINTAGTMMSGSVKLPNGNTKQITWNKMKPWPPENQLSPQFNFTPRDWAGDWEEDWSESSGHDRYRVKILDGGNRITVKPLNKPSKQKISNVVWTENRVTFSLTYGNASYHYELVPQDADTLDGLATSRAGKVKRIRWRRFVVRDSNLVPAWNALWRENWPGRSEQDIYEIRAT